MSISRHPEHFSTPRKSPGSQFCVSLLSHDFDYDFVAHVTQAWTRLHTSLGLHKTHNFQLLFRWCFNSNCWQTTLIIIEEKIFLYCWFLRFLEPECKITEEDTKNFFVILIRPQDSQGNWSWSNHAIVELSSRFPQFAERQQWPSYQKDGTWRDFTSPRLVWQLSLELERCE